MTSRHSHQFTEKGNKEVDAARGVYLKIFVGGSFLITLAIFSIFAIFWGALWRTPAHPLQGWIVDFDGGDVGSAVVQGLTSPAAISAGGSRIAWQIKSTSDFPGGPQELAEQVVDEQVWVAVTVNPDASSTLANSLATANTSYDGTRAVTIYASEARSENAFRSVIRPTVQAEFGALSAQFAHGLARLAVSRGVNATNLLLNSPQTLIQPLGYQLINLRPFDVPVASAITFVGLIYLLILSFFLVMIGTSAREVSGLERLLTTASLIKVRLATAFIGYFFLALFYSLLSLAFQVPFSRTFGRAGFLVFWMLNWIGMLSVGLALESLITILTIRFVPFFMLLWIVSNVSVCFLPIEVLPRIYRYGYASPFYNVSKGVRTIVFGTRNQLGLDFGVLIVWVVISCLSLPLFQFLARRKVVRGAGGEGVGAGAGAPEDRKTAEGEGEQVAKGKRSSSIESGTERDGSASGK